MMMRTSALLPPWRPYLVVLVLLACLPCPSCRAQGNGHPSPARSYFVDGYHGGIWGHYPEGYTSFICDQLDQHPDWNICLEIEPETWDTVAVKAPADLARLREYVKKGRVEFTNPSWAQPYLWNIDGECILRQMEVGMQTITKYFPEAQFVTYAVEEPCLTSSLPAMLSLLGFRHAVLRCPDTCWGGYPVGHGGELVNMVGPDGTSLLSVPRPACETLEPGSTWQTASWKNSRAYLTACREAGIAHPVGMCYQDAGWKNGPWMGDKAIYTTWTNYIEQISVGTTDDDWHFSQEDIRPCLMWGSSVMNRLAQEVRSAENALLQREKLSLLPGAPHDTLLADADLLDSQWKQLFLAQHHDTWIVPYNGLRGKRTWADWVTEWTTLPPLATAADAMLPTSTLRVFNTLGHARREMVRVDGRLCPVEVPAYGFRDYTAAALAQAAASATPCRVVEKNPHLLTVTNGVSTLTFDLDKGGTVSHLLYEDGYDFAGTACVENGDEVAFGALRGYFYDQERWCSSTEEKVNCTVEGDGTPCMTIVLEGAIAGSPFTQTYTLLGGERCIDCRLKVDWKMTSALPAPSRDGRPENGGRRRESMQPQGPGIGEYRQSGRQWRETRRAWCDDRYKLNLFFPVHLDDACLWKDAPFDVCESRQDSTWYGTWDDIRHNIILHWVDLSEGSDGHGLALFTDHTGSYGYGKEYPLTLTAQYSGVGLWGRNYHIEGPLEMHYALVPHCGQWDEAGVDRASRAWNEPLVSRVMEGECEPDYSLIDLGDSGLELSGVRRTDDGIEVRLYNAAGDATPQTIVLAGKPLQVSLPRHGLTTLKIN